jgi:membrane protein
MGAAFKIMRAAVEGLVRDNALQLAAAVAFYAVLSLVPMVILFLGIAGYIWERSEAQAELIAQVRNLAGPAAANAVESVVSKGGGGGGRGAAAIVALISLVLGATGAFSQLQSAMNKIWNSRPRHGNPIRAYAHNRLLTLLMLLVLGFILLFAVVLSFAIQLFMHAVGGPLAGFAWVWRVLNIASSLIVFTLTFAAIFKILPSAELAWSDVWLGAGVTAALFTVGKEVISLVLAHSYIASAYGAAGSMALLLLWVYYSSLIVFFGAEFTGAYSQWKSQTENEQQTSRADPSPA